MPSTNLNVVLLPLDIVPFNTAANLLSVETRMASLAEDTDLIVLPEMFNTGFTTDPELLAKIAEKPDGVMIRKLSEQASKHNVAIWGSMVSRNESDHFVNRGFMISPEGSVNYYDKRHTFSYGGESRAFSRGSQPAPIIDFRGWKLKMAICYDIRFPVWNRSRANEYDALIVPANWVHSRYYPWRQMLIARAIENQVYVVGCNREGNDAYGKYERGDSLAFDFYGKEIGTVHSDGSLSVTFDAHAIESARTHFAPWRDADDFTIRL